MSFLQKRPKLKILFLSSEEAPFAKVGGLGEVMFSLPRALQHIGHDVRVMLPRYGTIDLGTHKMPYIYERLEVPTAPDREGKRLICNVRKFEGNGEGRASVVTYFLENQEYYELRSNIYGYSDDRIRFALLSRGCLEFLNSSREWMPDLIVSSDWMTGYLPNFLKTDYQNHKRLAHLATVFSIHNISTQGTIRHHRFLAETERDDGYGPVPDFFGTRMPYVNAMRRGIRYADLITTVSPTYAKEVLTEEFGEGMEDILRERQDKLHGILNGIDYEINDPETDPILEKNFSAKKIHLRDENKLALQKRFGLQQNKGVFIAGIVSRLSRQKGFSLFVPIIESFLKITKAQLIAVGTGDTEIMDFFRILQTKFPEQVRVHFQFDENLPHLIYAGADVLLIPSQFEPSGLTQMEAMRFGAVPVARRIGGLADTIEDYSPEKDTGTGFLFDEFETTAFLIALIRSFVNWRHKDSWKKLQRRIMEVDFSWDRSAREYTSLFEKAIASRNGKNSYSP